MMYALGSPEEHTEVFKNISKSPDMMYAVGSPEEHTEVFRDIKVPKHDVCT